METQLLRSLDGDGTRYPFRFTGEKCDALAAIPIGSTLVWEMLMCARALGFFDFDLLSIPAFPKRIVEGSSTATSAIDISVSLHGINKLIVFQSSDYHHNGASARFMERIKEDAYHKACLISCHEQLKQRHPALEIILVYARVMDDGHVQFSLVEETNVERPIMRVACDCTAECDGVVVTCMDFRFWREYLSYLWYVLGVRKPTVISMPGSAKRINAGKTTALKALHLAKSVYAKNSAGFYLCQHQSCAAYGEEIFGMDGDREKSFQEEELEFATRKILECYGDVSVTKTYAGCDFQSIEFMKI